MIKRLKLWVKKEELKRVRGKRINPFAEILVKLKHLYQKNKKILKRDIHNSKGIIIRKYGLAYINVTKNASSSITRALLEMIYGKKESRKPFWLNVLSRIPFLKKEYNRRLYKQQEKIIRGRDLRPQEYFEKLYKKDLKNPSLTKFAFVRNPYDRMVSIYKDKAIGV